MASTSSGPSCQDGSVGYRSGDPRGAVGGDRLGAPGKEGEDTTEGGEPMQEQQEGVLWLASSSAFTTNAGCGRNRLQPGGAWDRRHEGTGAVAELPWDAEAGVRAEGVSLASPKAAERPRSWSCGPRGRPCTEGGRWLSPAASCGLQHRETELQPSAAEAAEWPLLSP